MTIDPVKIPQNVYVEDRIIGSITLRQIIICMLTGGVSYAIFASIKASGFFSMVTGVIAWTPLLIGAAFAFVKINGITLTRFCLLLLEKTDKPAIRVWAPRRGIAIALGAASVKSDKEIIHEKKEEEAKRRAEEQRKRIHELSALLDKGPDEPLEGMSDEVTTDATVLVTENEPQRPPLPVEKNRVVAEPLGIGTGTLDTVSSPLPAHAIVRDITPPALR